VLSNIKPDTLVPETTQGVIAARIDKLDDKLKHVLQVASVVGNEFTSEIFPLVSGIEKGLDSILQGLQGLELIHMTNLLPQPTYAFKHAITRESVYNSLTLRSRKEMHQKIGEALEKLNESNLDSMYETLAHHYSKSSNLEKAYLYLRLSADKAQAGYSNWEALRLFKEALDVLHRLPDSEENIRKDLEIRYQISAVMIILGYPDDDYLHILEEGERLSRGLGDERRMAEFCSLLGSYYANKGRSAEGKKYIGKAFRSAQLLQDIDLMVSIGWDLCGAYQMVGENCEIVELASSIVQAVEEKQRGCVSAGDKTPRYYTYILIHYGYAEGCLGNFEQGQAFCEKGLRLAHTNSDKFEICYAECFYGWLLIHKGELENALEHLENAITYCEEIQLWALSGISWAG
jgi:tetratricopeptide (TPR) repeat protein